MGRQSTNAHRLRKSTLADKRGAVRPLVIVLIVVLIACVVGGIAGGLYLANTYSQIKDAENSQNVEPTLPASEPKAAAQQADGKGGKIDFAALQKSNPDIYAWIFIPDTHINYPVCQNPEDNSYYLTHSVTGAESDVGAIFSEAQFNHTDFQDPVTILYGHNGYGSTMFTDLHEYEHQEFLDNHNRIYVYVPGHVYIYQVFSTFSAGDRHIMDAFSFQDESGIQRFIDFLEDPGAIDAHVVDDVEVNVDDKILVLSTCTTGVVESQGRYLVCGVMIDDQPTD